MDFHLPELGEGVYEAEVSRWLIQAGAQVKPGQPLLEVLTDKATMEVPTPFAGTIAGLSVQEGQMVKVGDVVLTYQAAGAEKPAGQPATVAAAGAPAPTAKPPFPQPPRSNGAPGLPVKAAPTVRLMARKLGIDLARVPGSGPAGRILVEDLTRFVPGAAPSSQGPPAEKVDYGRPGTRVKLLGLRRKIAEHMVLSKHTIPHFTYVDECDVTELVKLRKSLREPAQRKGVKLTYLAFFVKAVAGALRDVPPVNAFLDEAAGEIVLHEKCNVGIAVAAPHGLVVPVIHDADRLGLLDLAREIERLAGAVRAGKAKLDDMRGGTFTITSIGNFGGLFAAPIIFHPQVAILGIGKIVRRPVYDKLGQIQPADMVYLSLSFDHRVLDGAVGTAFGNALMERLRNPAAMLLEM